MKSNHSTRSRWWTAFGAASAFALTLGLAAPQPAAAMKMTLGKKMPEVIYPFPEKASEKWLSKTLSDEGFTKVAEVKKSGNMYHATAMWQGQPVHLTIDGLTGRVFDEESHSLNLKSK